MKCKEIIILGAGATANETSYLSPLLKNYQLGLGDLTQKGLLKAIYSYYIAVDRGNEIVKEWNIEEFFEKFWGITHSNYPRQIYPRLEDWFDIIDWAIKREEPLFNYNPTALAIRKACVIDLILDYLKILETPLFERSLHFELVSRLNREKLLYTTAFMSLNYDLMIDMSLKRFGTTINYGIQFNNHPTANPAKSALLLKLHGSLDWLCCKKDHLFFRDDLINLPPPRICPLCKSKAFNPLEILIIPPTFQNQELVEDSYINKLYKTAFQCFKSAERVYFCGYSIPEADMDFKYLIKKIESENGALPDVYLCNSPIRKTEVDRIRSIFRNKTNIHNTSLTFEEFVKKPHNTL